MADALDGLIAVMTQWPGLWVGARHSGSKSFQETWQAVC